MAGADPCHVRLEAGQFQHFRHQVGHAFTVTVFGFVNILCRGGNKSGQPVFKSDVTDIILHPVKDGFYFVNISSFSFGEFGNFCFEFIWFVDAFVIEVFVPVIEVAYIAKAFFGFAIIIK